MQPPRNPLAGPAVVKRRPFILVCALCSLFSAYCHRVAGGDIGFTPATPHPDGTSCNNPVQCASFSCSGGKCVAPVGGLVEIDHDCSGGETCVGDAKCEEGLCVANSLACAADGTPCLTGSDCCTEECDNGTCGFNDSCAQEDESCDVDGDCCTGSCPDFTCVSCSGSAEPCDTDSDCCSGVCDADFGFTCD
jgi:hypothetical protein